MSLIIFIAILVALIWVHELGHFTAAKFFGIRVDEFAIGFPPRLFRIKYGETEYTFNLLLVGGFVRIHGEDPGADIQDPRSMSAKPRPIQALVIVAGILMNLIFGWLALSSGYMAGMLATPESSVYGEVRDVRAVIGSVLHGSPAEKTGLMPGDAIVALQSGTMELAGPITATSVTEFIGVHQDESLVLEVQRNGEQKIIITKAEEGFIEGKKALGVSMADVGILQLPVHLALLQGAIAAKDVTIGTAQGLVSFFSMLALGQANWDSVAGPVGIATVGSSAVQEGFAAAAFLAALISVNLALINVLPIPGLDGGRLLIIIIEGVLRRPISPKVVTGLSLAGFALIITLMVVVTYHDIIKLLA